tara:strand:- start:8613 stop:9065 length:453 start_codon:yes stop_codon:yes gene_type:complete
MILKIDLTSSAIQYKLIKAVEKNIVSFYVPLFLMFFIFVSFSIQTVDASVIENDKLIEKISKDYSKKFCNSIAFGLSKKSAMDFSNKENNLIFKNKKGMDTLNKELLSNKIATSVVETCGYSVNLRGHEGIVEFEKDYMSMNNFIFQKKS